MNKFSKYVGLDTQKKAYSTAVMTSIALTASRRGWGKPCGLGAQRAPIERIYP